MLDRKVIVMFVLVFTLSFAQWIPQNLLQVPGQCYFPTVADVNRDGKFDIVANANPGGVWFWAGDTAHLPNWTPLDTVEMSGKYTYCTGIGDFNRDGKADLVTTSWPGLYTWTGDGAANPSWTPQAQPDQSGFYIGCRAADINHDTVCDIVASTSGGSNKGIGVWLSNGSQNPGWIRQPAPGPDTTYDYHTLTLADVNKDGHLDIIAGHQNDYLGIKVWTGNGGQGGQVIFTAQESPTATGQYLTVAVGDLNNDNNPDIVGAQQGSGIGVWLGDGNANPHWTAANAPPVSADVWGVNVGDLNRDGNLDIIASNISAQEIQAWFGNGGQGGNLVWTPAPAFSPSGYYEGVTIADVNYDGKPDVIAGNWNSQGVQIWINDITAVGESTPQVIGDLIGSCAPNPFCRRTSLRFSLKKETLVSFKVFDRLGRLLKASSACKFGPGSHQYTWDGYDQNGQKATAGTYFLVVELNSEKITRSVVYIRD